MAYIKTILRGDLGAGEVWSTSISWGIVGLAPDVPDDALVQDMANRLVAATGAGFIPTKLALLLSTAGKLTSYRVEKRGEDERVLSLGEASVIGNVAGSTTPDKTPQDAVVFSLRTGTPGARGRGRMYWPALSATLTSSYKLSSPTAAQVAADAKTLLDGIKTPLNAAYAATADVRTVRLSVRSVTDHVCRDVVKIQVGDVLDTQRRRRDALNEAYSSVNYP